MERIFKGMIGDFDSASISMAHEMDIRISDMIIHEMLPQAWMICFILFLSNFSIKLKSLSLKFGNWDNKMKD